MSEKIKAIRITKTPASQADPSLAAEWVDVTIPLWREGVLDSGYKVNALAALHMLAIKNRMAALLMAEVYGLTLQFALGSKSGISHFIFGLDECELIEIDVE